MMLDIFVHHVRKLIHHLGADTSKFAAINQLTHPCFFVKLRVGIKVDQHISIEETTISAH
jgi:hypothetical protein